MNEKEKEPIDIRSIDEPAETPIELPFAFDDDDEVEDLSCVHSNAKV